MKQEYKNYSSEDFEVWKTLFSRQKANLQGKACDEYLWHLDEMELVLHENKVPDFRELDEMLLGKTGWSIEVVPGLIPVGEFFELLARKKFCSSTWLRTMSQLDYLEEPDMFHDIFGHIPLLMNPAYAQFIEQIGILGLRYKNDQAILNSLEKLYWFTIEFGLLQSQGGLQIYGAGIISSFGETNHIYTDAVNISGFDLAGILRAEFTTSEVQNQYCSIDSFAQLYKSLDTLAQQWAPAVKKRA